MNGNLLKIFNKISKSKGYSNTSIKNNILSSNDTNYSRVNLNNLTNIILNETIINTPNIHGLSIKQKNYYLCQKQIAECILLSELKEIKKAIKLAERTLSIATKHQFLLSVKETATILIPLYYWNSDKCNLNRIKELYTKNSIQIERKNLIDETFCDLIISTYFNETPTLECTKNIQAIIEKNSTDQNLIPLSSYTQYFYLYIFQLFFEGRQADVPHKIKSAISKLHQNAESNFNGHAIVLITFLADHYYSLNEHSKGIKYIERKIIEKNINSSVLKLNLIVLYIADKQYEHAFKIYIQLQSDSHQLTHIRKTLNYYILIEISIYILHRIGEIKTDKLNT
ncbi:MAG: hypothetical protein KDC67_14195, partial [Ignavibacteriae bacterium]|nr:hypothetical protein [Ignavibacteriota bacterium]